MYVSVELFKIGAIYGKWSIFRAKICHAID